MADGTIVVENATSATGVNYSIFGSPSGSILCSGILGSVASGVPYPPEAKCAVSGYDQYEVVVGPIGSNPPSSASVVAKVDQQVVLASFID